MLFWCFQEHKVSTFIYQKIHTNAVNSWKKKFANQIYVYVFIQSSTIWKNNIAYRYNNNFSLELVLIAFLQWIVNCEHNIQKKKQNFQLLFGCFSFNARVLISYSKLAVQFEFDDWGCWAEGMKTIMLSLKFRLFG